jgi:DNA invertase Pin-like site-specific DNA recombinase
MTNKTNTDLLEACKKELNKKGFESRDWCAEQISVSDESEGKTPENNREEFNQILKNNGCEFDQYDGGTVVVWVEDSE